MNVTTKYSNIMMVALIAKKITVISLAFAFLKNIQQEYAKNNTRKQGTTLDCQGCSPDDLGTFENTMPHQDKVSQNKGSVDIEISLSRDVSLPIGIALKAIGQVISAMATADAK
jgi:hypothetical protein